jgi:hypothetical protein
VTDIALSISFKPERIFEFCLAVQVEGDLTFRELLARDGARKVVEG